MKKVDINILIQLLGMLSVLAGLLFVGLEMRQSQRIALAEQQQQRAAMEIENIHSFFEAGVDFDNVLRKNPADLSETESVARSLNYHNRLYIVENDFIQYQNGLMSPEVYEAKKQNLSFLMDQCDLREIFEWRKAFLSKEFLELINTVPNKCVNQ